MGDWFPDCDCECDPTQVGCDQQEEVDPGDVTNPPEEDPGGTDSDVDPDPPDGTEEDPGVEPPGGGSAGGGGAAGGSTPPPSSGQTQCETEPTLTGVTDSTADPQITLGEPESTTIGIGVYASNGGVVELKSPVIIGMSKCGIECRRNALVDIPNSVIRGGQFGILCSLNATVKAKRSVVCRTGAIHAEHAAVVSFGRDSLSKNNRRNIAADASFMYVVNSTFQTTRFDSDTDKAYGLLTLSHLVADQNSTLETTSGTLIRGDLGENNLVADNSSVYEGEPTVE